MADNIVLTYHDFVQLLRIGSLPVLTDGNRERVMLEISFSDKERCRRLAELASVQG